MTSPLTGTVIQLRRVGNRTRLAYPGGGAVTSTYDALNRLQTVEDWEAGRTVYTYTAAGRLSGASWPNDVETAYGYGGAGRLVEIEHRDRHGELLARYEYRWTAVGNRVQVTETLAWRGRSWAAEGMPRFGIRTGDGAGAGRSGRAWRSRPCGSARRGEWGGRSPLGELRGRLWLGGG